jgi:glycogen synthase
MTRVLMTTDAVGGVWTYSLELVRALARHGVTVDLAVLGPPPSPAQHEQMRTAGCAGVHGHAGALEWMDDPWDDVDAAGAWLLELAGVVHPDVVHLNGYAHAALPWGVPTVVAAHSDVVSWWRAVHGSSALSASPTYRQRVGAGLAAATTVVAPTAAVLGDLCASFGFTGGTVIPNGRRPPPFAGRPGPPFVLSAGRMWDEAKNLGALAAVAPELDHPVLVAGGGPEHTGPGLAPLPDAGLHVLGWVEPVVVARWLSRAPVFAAPARYEPFGLGALEAAQAGCALVLGDIPSLREVWGGSAVYVPPDDHDALAEALRRLLSDGAERARWGIRARTHAQRYDPDRMGEAYAQRYAALTAGQVA